MNEPCGRCGRVTETVLLPLASGHVGRVCAVCHSCRRGRPYARREEFENLKQADSRNATRGHKLWTKRSF